MTIKRRQRKQQKSDIDEVKKDAHPKELGFEQHLSLSEVVVANKFSFDYYDAFLAQKTGTNA